LHRALARETGLRIGDLVELERSEIKRAPDGSRAIILRPNKRRRRIVNMPLTPAAVAIIDKAPQSRRPSLRFNDLRMVEDWLARPRIPHRWKIRSSRDDACFAGLLPSNGGLLW
jgi:integrase